MGNEIDDQTIEHAVSDLFRHRSWEGDSLSVPRFSNLGLLVRSDDPFNYLLRLVGELATNQHTDLYVGYFGTGEQEQRQEFDRQIDPYRSLFEEVTYMSSDIEEGRRFIEQNNTDLVVSTLGLLGGSDIAPNQLHSRVSGLIGETEAQLFAVPNDEVRSYDSLRQAGAGILLNFSALETFLPHFGQLLRDDITLPLFTYMPEDQLLEYIQQDQGIDEKQLEYFRNKTFEQVQSGLEDQVRHFGRPLRDQDIYLEHDLLTEQEELVDQLKGYLSPDPAIFGFALPKETVPGILKPIFSAIYPSPLFLDVCEEEEGGWASRLLS